MNTHKEGTGGLTTVIVIIIVCYTGNHLDTDILANYSKSIFNVPSQAINFFRLDSIIGQKSILILTLLYMRLNKMETYKLR